jgi:Ca2+-binding RTX toxin-like protein
MAVHRINADYNTHFDISASNDTWIFARGISVFAQAYHGIYVDAAFSASNIQLYGEAFGALDGMHLAGASTGILISTTGSAGGVDNGVAISGNHGALVNHGYIFGEQENGVLLSGVSAKMASDGYISGETAGILAETGKYTIDNNGTTIGQNGISSTNSDLHLTLGTNSYVIATQLTGIAILATAANTTQVVNHGVVRGIGYAYSGGEGADHLTNTGYMRGDIDLRGGDDVVDLRLGFVSGSIYGSGGNDTYLVSSQATRIFETAASGTDTVKSTASYVLGSDFENLVLLGTHAIDGTGNGASNAMTGNGAANLLKGLAGQDILTGGGGNDLLYGGADADRFVFRSHFGHDTINDFAPGADRIDLSHLSHIANYTDLVKHHLTASGDTLRITDGTDVIVLAHTHKGDIHAADFIF